MRSVRAANSSAVISDRPAADAEQLVLRREVLDGGSQQAAGEEQQSNPTAKRLHVGFILKQILEKCFEAALLSRGSKLLSVVRSSELPVQDVLLDGGPDFRARINQFEMPHPG